MAKQCILGRRTKSRQIQKAQWSCQWWAARTENPTRCCTSTPVSDTSAALFFTLCVCTQKNARKRAFLHLLAFLLFSIRAFPEVKFHLMECDQSFVCVSLVWAAAMVQKRTPWALLFERATTVCFTSWILCNACNVQCCTYHRSGSLAHRQRSSSTVWWPWKAMISVSFFFFFCYLIPLTVLPVQRRAIPTMHSF